MFGKKSTHVVIHSLHSCSVKQLSKALGHMQSSHRPATAFDQIHLSPQPYPHQSSTISTSVIKHIYLSPQSYPPHLSNISTSAPTIYISFFNHIHISPQPFPHQSSSIHHMYLPQSPIIFISVLNHIHLNFYLLIKTLPDLRIATSAVAHGHTRLLRLAVSVLKAGYKSLPPLTRPL